MLIALLIACRTPTPSETDSTDTDTEVSYTSEVYSDPDHWLCHPDRTDGPCNADLDTTIVYADGTTELRPHVRATDPPFDCFYVYPTISGDTTTNSDLDPGPEEHFTTEVQFARYSEVCRPFAPVYRQMTITALLSGTDPIAPFTTAYADVEDAWRHYLANDNDGRPVLLVGHSQGAVMLKTLLGFSIEADDAVQDRIVGAHLIGFSVQVPEGEAVGGDLQETPICESPDEAGCVVTYLSFRPSAPPGPAVFVGQPPAGWQVPCTHPGAIGSGAGALSPVFPSFEPGGFGNFIAGFTSPWENPAGQPAIQTPYFALPDLVQAECLQAGDFGYLSVSVAADPADVRVDDVEGDFLPGWGLHVIDVNLAMDDLVDVAVRQHAAWEAR